MKLRRYWKTKWHWSDYFKKIAGKNQSKIVIFAILLLPLLLSISIEYNWLAILAIPLFFIVIFAKRKDKRFKVYVIIIAVILILQIALVIYSHWNVGHINNQQFKVIKKFKYGAIVESNLKSYYITDLNNDYLNAVFNLTGQVTPINQSGGFYDYLKGQNVYYQIVNYQSEFLFNSFSIRNYFANLLLDKPEYYRNYVGIFFLGQNLDPNNDIISKFKGLNILHLIVISGFHLNFLILIVRFILNKFKLSKFWVQLICILILIFPLLLYGLQVSIFRVWSVLIIAFVFQKYKFNRLHILIISASIWLIIKPQNYFSIGFIFSYSLSSLLVVLSKVKIKNIYARYLFVNLFLSFSTVILVLISNHQINIYFVLMNLVYTPIIMILYITSIFIIWWVELLNYLYLAFDYTINGWLNNSIFIIIDNINLFWELPYYLTLLCVAKVLSIYKKKKNYSRYKKAVKLNVV